MRCARFVLNLVFAATLLGVAGEARPVPTMVEGKVSRVTDGDTLWVRPAGGGRPIKVRLDGLDAPEICQPGGREARKALQRLVLRRSVTVEVRLRDDYGRRIATLRREGLDVGEQLVREGHAWNDRYHGMAGRYAAAEDEARAARRGIFGGPAALTPREFRARHGPCRR